MEYKRSTRPQLLRFQKAKTNKLFLSTPQAGRAVEQECSLQIWKGFTKDLKLKHPTLVNFKHIRASVITNWLGKHNLREIQYMAGHRYVSSTESYLVNQTESLVADIDKFHPF